MEVNSTAAMENYYLEPTRITPMISLKVEDGILELRGRSSPENPLALYQDILDHLNQFAQSEPEKLEVHIELDYFNTSSSKCIYEILRKASAMSDEGIDVLIKWYYEEDDEDMIESGEDFEDLLDMEFEFVEIEI